MTLMVHSNAKKPETTNPEQRSGFIVLCIAEAGFMIIYVDLQRQLECISPPVSTPTTCTVTHMGIYMYLVPACTSPAGFQTF